MNFACRHRPATARRWTYGLLGSSGAGSPPSVADGRPILERELATAETEPKDREERLRAQRRGLPDAPGVYLFRDDKRRVLYVGKAKSLRKRVAGHFSNPSTRGASGLLGEMGHIEFIVT